MSAAAQIELGSVVSLWRYPVKSMMGEELNATKVTERGLVGDRAYALIDSSLIRIYRDNNLPALHIIVHLHKLLVLVKPERGFPLTREVKPAGGD